MKLEAAAKSLFLKEFLGAFWLSMRYIFKPKATFSATVRCGKSSGF